MKPKNQITWFIVVAAWSIVAIGTVVVGKAVYTALELMQISTQAEISVRNVSQLTKAPPAKQSPRQIQTKIITQKQPQIFDNTNQPNKSLDFQVSNKEPDEQQNKQVEYEKKAKEIEAHIVKQKQKVESNYAWQLAQLQQTAEAKLLELKAAERSALARFNQNLKNTISETYSSKIIGGSVKIDGHVSPYGHIDRYGYIDGYGSSYERTHKYVVGDPAKDYALETGRITNANINTLQDFEYELARLRAAKEQDFDKLDRLEKLYKINIYQSIFSIKPSFGTVTAIAYSKDNPAVMIDGQILHTGDAVQGVKILKINKRQVEFEKNGLKWTQGINQTPDPHWK